MRKTTRGLIGFQQEPAPEPISFQAFRGFAAARQVSGVELHGRALR
jgi:hypothetical protein